MVSRSPWKPLAARVRKDGSCRIVYDTCGMVRLRRTIWVTALLLFCGLLLLRVVVSLADPGQGVFGAVLLGLGLVFVTAVLVAVLGLLVGLPRLRSTASLKERIWLRLPFAFIAAVAVMIGAAFLPEWWEAQHGMDPVAVKYEEIELAADMDCAEVHDGVFVGPAVRIERRGNVQYQKGLVLGVEQELLVRWRDPCTYVLMDSDSIEFGHVRITAVDRSGYDCLVTMGPGSVHAYAIRLDRSEGGS